MSLWSFRKKAVEPTDAGRAQKRKKTVKRSPPVAMEVKVLAIEVFWYSVVELLVDDVARGFLEPTHGATSALK